MPARTKARRSPRRPRCCSPRSPSAAKPRNTTASRPPTTASSTTTTRPARARRSSWCASRSATRIMRSGFGARNHPILGYFKMHTGVDWADALRHADLRLRQRHGREGRLGRRLRQIRPHQAQQRLRDRLRPHVGVRQGHGARQARAPGPGDRLRRLDRPLDRRRTSTTRSWSTAASSIRCASSCRAAARSKDRSWRASRRSATASTPR